MHADLQAAAEALFDLEPDTVRCPYPLFAKLSEHAPVMWSDELEAFVITQYDLIVDVLRHPEAFSSRNTTGPKTDRRASTSCRQTSRTARCRVWSFWRFWGDEAGGPLLSKRKHHRSGWATDGRSRALPI